MFQPFTAGAAASTASLIHFVRSLVELSVRRLGAAGQVLWGHPFSGHLFRASASGGGDRSGLVPQPRREPRSEKGRHVVYGSPVVVQSIIKTLHHLGYAEPNEWSRPMPTARSGEVMCILTKSVRVQ